MVNGNSQLFICKANFNKSMFDYGITVAVDYHIFLEKALGKKLVRGTGEDISLLYKGIIYNVKVKNNNNRKSTSTSNDDIQIRYPQNKGFAPVLQADYKDIYDYLCRENKKEKVAGKKKPQIVLPENIRPTLYLFFDTQRKVFEIQIDDNSSIADFKNNSVMYDEISLENIFDYNIKDENAGVKSVKGMRKIRQLNSKIGENLKQHYGYRCQICNKVAGDEYGLKVAEVHHIDYFMKSFNNDISNLIVVCPNHHRIIHKLDPVFDRESLSFKYNGGEIKVVLDEHLKISQ